MIDSSKNCLVIPDIHQNIRWAEAILQKEAANADRIVLLGDYFDTKVHSAANVAETCIYLTKLSDRFSAKFSFLVGNHDLPYLYDVQNNRRPKAGDSNPYRNGVYEPYLSDSIKQNLSTSFLNALEPFAFVQGWILSHAGIHSKHLDTENLEGLESLYHKLKKQVVDLPREMPVELAAVGTARGGTEKHGGITWQDWFNEFDDTLEWPQIVGHTLIPEPDQKGRSWDLDTKVGSYGILVDGELEIRYETKDPAS